MFLVTELMENINILCYNKKYRYTGVIINIVTWKISMIYREFTFTSIRFHDIIKQQYIIKR